MTSLLNVQSLNKSYKDSDFHLHDINFSIYSNEVVGLIGKNGSGKSTLINTLVGNRHLDSGEVTFFNKTSSNEEEYKEHIGVVFDDLRVPNKLSLKEIDKIFSNIYQSWDSKTFHSIINYFELPFTNAIKTFSRGMRMKTALSIALAHDTRLLILDEATAGMDASGREEVIELLEDFTAKGNAILLASHISDDMEKLASKLIFMKDGKIILEENKDNLLNNYDIVEVPQVDFNVPTEMIIASRVRQNKIIALINNYHQIKDAHPLTNIDDATKIIMRGEQ